MPGKVFRITLHHQVSVLLGSDVASAFLGWKSKLKGRKGRGKKRGRDLKWIYKYSRP